MPSSWGAVAVGHAASRQGAGAAASSSSRRRPPCRASALPCRPRQPRRPSWALAATASPPCSSPGRAQQRAAVRRGLQNLSRATDRPAHLRGVEELVDEAAQWVASRRCPVRPASCPANQLVEQVHGSWSPNQGRGGDPLPSAYRTNVGKWIRTLCDRFAASG